MRVPFHELQSNFTSGKFILQIRNKITSCKFIFGSWELLFKEIILGVAIFFTSCELRFASWEFKIINLQVESLRTIKFTSCEVAFYELKIYDASFTNYDHMFEPDFKEINLCNLCENTILIKWILILTNLNTSLVERY